MVVDSFPKGTMKKFCLALLYFGFLAGLYWYLTTPKKPAPIYVSPQSGLLEEKPTSVHYEVYECVKRINEKNSRITSIIADKVKILVWHDIGIAVNGKIAMQKDQFFRLKVSGYRGPEMDIGSNESLFWFWSRSMPNPALYYARHEDLSKTMLKTPLNPSWLMESLSLNEIDMNQVEIVKVQNYWAILQPRNSSLGEKITIATLIDPQRDVIIGHYLYNAEDKLVASTEIKEFNGDVPKKILIVWYDENVRMEWDIIDPQINVDIDKNYWQLPMMKNKINMGEE